LSIEATVLPGLRDVIHGGIFVLSPSVSVVIPALNEERNIPHVLSRIPDDIHQVILVDGESTDNTVEAARNVRPDVFVVKQTRRGKGNALACGFEAATGDVIVMLDADGSADPGEMPRFVDALVAGADFAKGTRFASGGGSSDITRLRKLGNDGLTAIFNLCYGCRYSDLCYGYNVFWRYCLPVLGLDSTAPAPPGGGKLWGDGFEVETLIHVRIAKAGLKVAEVPSYEYPRLHGVSNLNATRDGLRVVRTMLAERRDDRPALAPVREQSSSAVAPRMHQEPSSTVVPVVLPGHLATEEESVL
jgi:glycosyltransferase involved in cell wall biosynthesis